LRAAGLRAVLGFAVLAAGLARVAPVRDAADPLLLARVPVERFAEVLRAPVERELLAFRAAGRELDDDDDLPELARAGVPSSAHFPDMTRCAASATASAIS
jgi:hypothetical protein